MNIQPPVILLAFSNDNQSPDTRIYLPALAREAEYSKSALLEAEKQGLCKVELVYNATLNSITDAFNRHSGQVAIFHYSGHSDQRDLLLEDLEAGSKKINHQAFSDYLAQQEGLVLTFFNSCISYNLLPAFKRSQIPCLIYTNEHIIDGLAAEFAQRFYRGISKGKSIKVAFESAKALALADGGFALGNATRALKSLQTQNQSERPVWELFRSSDFHEVLDWSLPIAADRRLTLLPAIPASIPYPTNPYKQLKPYGRSDARVFWGRESELLQLYYWAITPEAQNILILQGSAGSGKTSLLNAGLLPRLENEFTIIQVSDLSATIPQAERSNSNQFDILAKTAEESIDYFRSNSSEFKKDVLLVMDHCELGMQNAPEFDAILRKLSAIADVKYPDDLHVKLILVVRNDFSEELEALLDPIYGGYFKAFVGPFSQHDITKFVNGIASTQDHKRQFNFEIHSALAQKISHDLGKKPESLITPILQMIMSKLYQDSVDASRRSIDLSAYEALDIQDLMKGFVIAGIKSAYAHPALKPVKDSGLIENILADFVGEFGRSAPKTETEICQSYPKQKPEQIKLVLGHLKDEGRLLVDLRIPGRNGERWVGLIHDILGPLIKDIQYKSILPGPQAIRILDRITGAEEVLSPVAVKELERGLPFLSHLNDSQKKVLKESKIAMKRGEKMVRRKRNRGKARWGLIGITGLILLIPGADFLSTYGLIYLIMILFIYKSG